jgi:hypothetical protein
MMFLAMADTGAGLNELAGLDVNAGVKTHHSPE